MHQPSNTVTRSPGLQKQIARMTREALSELLKAARRAQPTAANISEIQARLVNCVGAAHLFQEAIRAGHYNPRSEATQARHSHSQEEMQAELGTLDAAEAAARSMYEALCAAIEALPEDQLGQSPFTYDDPGTDMTVADVLFLPSQHLSYQTGQIDLLNQQAE